MYRTEKECVDRPKFSTRKKFAEAFYAYTERSEMIDMINDHFRENPPIIRNKSTGIAPDHPFTAITRALASPVYSHSSEPVDAVLNTFKYLFDRHKSGIYVSVRGNNIVRFSSFSNIRYRNPLSRLLTLSPEDTARVEASETHMLNVDSATWSTMDCLVGNVAREKNPAPNDGYEPTYNFTEVYTMVQMTCKKRKIGDCDFFVNLWDRLMLRRDLCVPHLSITGGRLLPIHEYKNKPMCPIVSFCSAEDYLDIPFVFPDDVQRITESYFIPRCGNGFADLEKKFVTTWSKKPYASAVFRGTATGCGWTVETNPRLYAAALTAELEKKRSRKSKTKTKSPPLVDARLVGSHLERFKKPMDSPQVHFFTDERVIPMQSDDNRLDLAEQSKYKYVIDLPGNVIAYRMAGMFGLGSVIIAVLHERYRPWIFPLMKPDGPEQNCIILEDVTKLLPTVEWCRDHEADCALIAERGLDLYRTMIRKEDALMDYVALMMNSISMVSCKSQRRTRTRTRTPKL